MNDIEKLQILANQELAKGNHISFREIMLQIEELKNLLN